MPPQPAPSLGLRSATGRAISFSAVLEGVAYAAREQSRGPGGSSVAIAEVVSWAGVALGAVGADPSPTCSHSCPPRRGGRVGAGARSGAARPLAATGRRASESVYAPRRLASFRARCVGRGCLRRGLPSVAKALSALKSCPREPINLISSQPGAGRLWRKERINARIRWYDKDRMVADGARDHLRFASATGIRSAGSDGDRSGGELF